MARTASTTRMARPLASVVCRVAAEYCPLCGGTVEPEDLHLDHIRPWSKGGSDFPSNLQVTHGLCNIRKGARYVLGSV